MSVNQRFRNIRNSFHLTQEMFGKRLDVNQANITDIERGKILPNIKVMEKLHFTFGINLNWLLCGSGKMKLEPGEIEETATKLQEPTANYLNYKDKYIEALEDNIKLRKELEECRRNPPNPL